MALSQRPEPRAETRSANMLAGNNEKLSIPHFFTHFMKQINEVDFF